MAYGFVGTMQAKPDRRDYVVAILLRDQSALADIGCRAYIVGVNDDEPNLIYVTEVWESKQAHDDSLQLESVKAAIQEAMPMLTGEFSSQQFTIVGGLGS